MVNLQPLPDRRVPATPSRKPKKRVPAATVPARQKRDPVGANLELLARALLLVAKARADSACCLPREGGESDAAYEARQKRYWMING